MRTRLHSRNKNPRILVVRCDRLGDVILSTPVFEVIKRHNPHSFLTVMVRGATAPILDGLKFIDEIMIFDPEGRHAGVRGFFRLVSEIRAKNFRIAVVLQSQWKIAAAIFFSNIRYRVGPLSRLYSFLFYNRGIRQHRSQVEMHEADYNLQLLRRLGIRVGTRNVPVSVYASEESVARARSWLVAKGWNAEKPLIAVHPGMGGSALNWPEHHYVAFILALLKDGKQVVVTGGVADRDILLRIRESLGSYRDKAIWQGWDADRAEGAIAVNEDGKSTSPSRGTIQDLVGILNWASMVVAPSTGPLHLAVAMGKSVVTFFPPIRVQSAVRWGPYIKDDSKVSILIPEVYCGQEFKCRGSLCHYYPCMKSLSVAQALEETALQLSRMEREADKG